MIELSPMLADRLGAICQRFEVRRLAMFGSALREDFSSESDLDILVEFQPGVRTGLRLIELEDALTELFGRKVDLNTPGFLSREFRDRVIREAQDLYVAA